MGGNSIPTLVNQKQFSYLSTNHLQVYIVFRLQKQVYKFILICMNDNLPLMNAVIVIWLLNVHILLFFFIFLF